MLRFAWLQSRTQLLVAASLLAAVGAVLAFTGPHLVALYDASVATCVAPADCTATVAAFLRNDDALRNALDVLLVVVPAVIGIFFGAPLVARELETGTHRLAWTQSVTRTRWAADKIGVVGAAAIALTAVFSVAVTWWASPLDRAQMAQFGSFDQRDLVPVGYAAFAFALGATIGTLSRRTLVAMALTLVLFTGTRLAAAETVRPHLLAVSDTNLALTTSTDLGFTPSPAGVTFTAGPPNLPDAWVISSQIIDDSGQPATDTTLNQFLEAACPAIAHPPPPDSGVSRGPANQTLFHDCLDQLSSKFHLSVTYLPADDYWALQWRETLAYLTAALGLIAFSLLWLRHRAA